MTEGKNKMAGARRRPMKSELYIFLEIKRDGYLRKRKVEFIARDGYTPILIYNGVRETLVPVMIGEKKFKHYMGLRVWTIALIERAEE